MVWVGSQGKFCQGSEAALAPPSVTCSQEDPVFFHPSPDLSGKGKHVKFLADLPKLEVMHFLLSCGSIQKLHSRPQHN